MTPGATSSAPSLRLGVQGDALRQQANADLAVALLRPTVPEYEIRRHQHDDAHIVVLLAGSYVSDAAGMPGVCTEAAVVLNPPGTEHRDRFRSRDGRFLTLTMASAAYARLCEGAGATDRAVRLPASALAPALRLLPEISAWDSASPLAVESLFAELIASAGRERPVGDDNGVLLRVRERLDDDARRAPSLAELASIADYHPVHLARVFRKHFRMAPSEYLRRRRLHRAVSLIAARRTLADAAATLGFVDGAHLHRCFVAEFGMTPGTFRRLALGRANVSKIQDARLRRC